MTAYYNEIDPQAAQWLRNLIAAGHIAPGDVDERSIVDVRPSDLRGYTQCHFFAGVGVWSYALRNAGWLDTEEIWTGSCPCQPFSSAGQRGGFADERHLWPHFHWLIEQCRPAAVLGEQVASKAVEPWIDLVQADLEVLGYAFGCIPFPSAGGGAPMLRDRAFWVADASDERSQRRVSGRADTQRQDQHGYLGRSGSTQHLADANMSKPEQSTRQRPGPGEAKGGRPFGKLDGCSAVSGAQPAGPTNSFWRDADWIFCRDGKWRPVEPSTFPLAHGATARVVRLRAYGNAINAEAAHIFIESWLEAKAETRPVDLDDLI